MLTGWETVTDILGDMVNVLHGASEPIYLESLMHIPCRNHGLSLNVLEGLLNYDSEPL